MKLGKLPARNDPRTLKLSKYLRAIAPAPPAVDWTTKIAAWGAMLNDSTGDCVFAAAGHATQTWTAAQGIERTPPDSQILSYYEQWAGYNPSDPSTDQGAVELDFLNRWRRDGFCGAILSAYADPDPKNIEHIKQSIALFGGVYVGVQLPNSALDQFNAGEPWTIAGDGTIAGGHALWLPKYDSQWLYCVTWGKLQPMAYGFFENCCDEAHALCSPEFLNAQGVSASRVDFAAWDADLEQVVS